VPPHREFCPADLTSFALGVVLYGACSMWIRAQESARIHFDIEAVTLNEAMREFREQSGLDVLSWEDRVKDVPTPNPVSHYRGRPN
jgi:hypothetical protein